MIKTEKTNSEIKDFVKEKENGKKVFDLAKFKKYLTTSVQYSKFYESFNRSYLGFSRCEIEKMSEHPEFYGKRIVTLSQYMYFKSGYYKRLIDYFVNQAKLNYTIDTKVLRPGMITTNKVKEIKKDYIGFAVQSEKFNLRSEIHNILKRLYRDDACFAYVLENDTGISYYYFDPMVCSITELVDGHIYQFSVDIGISHKFGYYETYPEEIRRLLENGERDINGRVKIPMHKSLCIKYNNDVPYLYPPFFMMIADILLIDEYKDLAKAQSINDAYKLLTLEIPTKDGEISLGDGLISTFVGAVMDTVQNNIGVICTPFKTNTEEFSSSNADDRDTVSDAISWAFKNVGVSEALMSGASSGSELKLSITNDSGDIFRIYRMIEDWVKLQMGLRGYLNTNYEFIYRILDMTTFNSDEYVTNQLKLAQNGLPNKQELVASNGISPSVMIGNSVMENEILGEMFEKWTPLSTSYTQSSSKSSTGSSTETTIGRPKSEDGDLSAAGEISRENDTNDPNNRI